jgi:hypothetical protein
MKSNQIVENSKDNLLDLDRRNKMRLIVNSLCISISLIQQTSLSILYSEIIEKIVNKTSFHRIYSMRKRASFKIYSEIFLQSDSFLILNLNYYRSNINW